MCECLFSWPFDLRVYYSYYPVIFIRLVNFYVRQNVRCKVYNFVVSQKMRDENSIVIDFKIYY